MSTTKTERKVLSKDEALAFAKQAKQNLAEIRPKLDWSDLPTERYEVIYMSDSVHSKKDGSPIQNMFIAHPDGNDYPNIKVVLQDDAFYSFIGTIQTIEENDKQKMTIELPSLSELKGREAKDKDGKVIIQNGIKQQEFWIR